MNRKIKMAAAAFFAALALSAVSPVGVIKAFAASARIAFSDPSATVGQEFNVTVKISSQDGNLGASDVMLSYDPSVIEFVSGNNASGGAGAVRLVGTMDSSTTKEFSYTLKFKALQAGNTAISVGSYEVYDVDAQAVDVSKVGSSAVKVNAPATYSSDASLSSLKVSPGQLSPAFSSGVTSYTVQVGADVDKLAVSANASDSKAKVVVSGNSDLKTGSNTVVCKVTAEDGQTTKSYTITVTKLEAGETAAESDASPESMQEAVLGDQTVDVDGVTYTVAASFDPALLPEGYTSSTCTYGGSEVMCGTGNDLTLLYLQSGDGTGSFFIYVPSSGALSPYVTIDVTAKSILVLPPDDSVEIPEGFAATTIQLNGNYKVQGWVWQSDEEQRYCIVYGMNENGEKGLYRYDIGEKTFQRYFEDPALQSKYDDAKVEELYNTYNELCRDYNIRLIIIIALVVVCLLLFFIVLNLLLRRREIRENRSMSSQNREAMTPVKRREMEQKKKSEAPVRVADTYRDSERHKEAVQTSPARRAAQESRPRQQEAARRNMPARREDTMRERGYERRQPSARSQKDLRRRDAAPHNRSEVSPRTQDRAYHTPGYGEAVRTETEYRRPSEYGNTREYEYRTGGRANAQTDKAYKKPGSSRYEYGSGSDSYTEREYRRAYDAGMEEAIRQREMERAHRARMARERLERERREDERRARMESAAGVSRRNTDADDDFEVLDLN